MKPVPDRQVILIFGNATQGKSSFAKELKTKFGYHVVHLDEVYVTFIKDRYPNLYLEALQHVIGQHYEHILVPCDEWSIAIGARAAWRDHVASLVDKEAQKHSLLAVEGYLLFHAMGTVQERLKGKAIVTIIEARNKQCFIAENGQPGSLKRVDVADLGPTKFA
jgi:hypothetical protein